MKILLKFFLLLIIPMVVLCSQSNRKSETNLFLSKLRGETVVPRKANKILIEKFVNKSRKSDLENILILKLKEKISANGRLAISTEKDNPDVKLSGEINSFQIQPILFNSSGIAEKKRLRVLISIKFINLKSGKLILHEKNIQAFRVFSETTLPIEFEEMAIDRVINEIADRIFEKIMTGWYSKLLTDIEKGK